MKKVLVMACALALSTSLFASKDYYTIKKSEWGETFVGACAAENTADTGIDQIHFESFCRCVWRGLSTEFTNQELEQIDNSVEPLYSEFSVKTDKLAQPCIDKYIKR